MFTDKSNVLELIALLLAHNIKHVVLCPGSRDIPIVQALSQLSEINCYSVTDERSAGFFALGTILAHKEPCAVVVTSGSALLNLHPCVAEAHYQNLPLLIISADRPLAWINQMDGQTINQTFVFNSLVKYETTANEIKDDTDRWLCNRVCNEALLKLREKPYAPVHINVPISDPFFSFNTKALPKARVIKNLALTDLCKLCTNFHKIYLILGQSSIEEPLSSDLKSKLAKRFVVISEHIANASFEGFIKNPEEVFSKVSNKEQKLCPDLVISIGGHIISKKLKQFLRSQDFVHVNISDDGKVCDLFCKLAYTVKASYHDALSALCNIEKAPLKLTAKVFSLENNLKLKDLPFSQVTTIGKIINKLNFPCFLHLGNSSTVRYAQNFELPSCVTVHANRGVNGIEGSLSTAIGVANAQPHLLNFILIGDLSFFYDMNALWNNHLNQNLRIIMFNNSGGEIFSALPGLSLDKKAYDYIVAPHSTSAVSWAQERGFKTYQVRDNDALDTILGEFIKNDNCNKFIEVISNRESDIEVLKDLKNNYRLNYLQEAKNA